MVLIAFIFNQIPCKSIANLQKNREDKLKELEKIDKALEKQKKDIKKSTQKIAVSVDPTDIKNRKLPNVAGKLTDLHWVLERFTY